MSDPEPKSKQTASPVTPSAASSEMTESGFDWLRTSLGGALMGLANLVPGLSGGTMLVAIGIYKEVIDAVSEATRLRLSRKTVLTLGVIIVSAGIAIGSLAWAISLGLAQARWAMYAAFIGLTWGGAPLLIRMTKPFGLGAILGLVGGVLGMLTLVWLQQSETTGQAGGPVSLVVAGAAGASAMILPGVSGAYLLMMLGEYERIIAAIKDSVSAASSGNISGVIDQLSIIVPVGIGVIIGVVVVSNALRVLIHRFEKPTYGVLLGLLLAAPAGLYPFVEGVPPKIGETFEGELVTQENIEEYATSEYAKDWEQRAFTPGAVHLGGVLVLIGGGFFATLLLSRLAGDDGHEEQDQSSDECTAPAS